MIIKKSKNILSKLSFNIQKLSLYRNYNDYYEKDETHQKIINTKTISDITSLYESIKPTISLFHTISILKNISKISKTQRDYNAIPYINELWDSVFSAPDNLSSQDLLDVLFTIRKFNGSKIKLNIEQDKLDIFYSKINENIENNIYGLRALTNLLFDLSNLRRKNDIVAEKILDILKSKEAQPNFTLSAMIIIQIIQSGNFNFRKGLKHKELVAYVIQNSLKFYGDFDIDQQAMLFKIIARIDYKNGFYNYKQPSILNNLKLNLKAKLEELGENSILGLIEAHQYLGQDIKSDLLDEIRNMVNYTMQENSSIINMKFISEYLKLNEKVKKRPLKYENKLTIYNELAKRVAEIDRKSFNSLYEIVKSITSKNVLTDAIYDHVKSNNNDKFDLKLIEYLKMLDYDITEDLLEKAEFKENSDTKELFDFRLKYLLSNDGASELLETLNLSESNNIKYLLTMINIDSNLLDKISDIYIKNYDNYNAYDKINIIILMLKYKNFKFQHLQKIFKEVSLNFENNIFGYLKANITNFESKNFLVFEFIIELYKRNNLFIMENLFDVLNSNKLLLNDMVNKNVNYIFKVYKEYVGFLKSNRNSDKPVLISNSLLFIENLKELNANDAVVNMFYYNIMKEELSNNNIKLSKNERARIASRLINYNNVSNDIVLNAYKVLELSQKQFLNNINEVEIAIYLYCRNVFKEDPEESELLKSKITAIVEKNKVELDNTVNPKKILNAVSVFLKLPFKLIKELPLLKAIKDNLNYINNVTLVKLLFSINETNVKYNFDYFYPIINELIGKYYALNKYIYKNDTLFIFLKLNKLNYHNIEYFDKFSENLLKNIRSYKDIELMYLLRVISGSKYCNINLVNAIVQKIYSKKYFFNCLSFINRIGNYSPIDLDSFLNNINKLEPNNFIDLCFYEILNSELTEENSEKIKENITKYYNLLEKKDTNNDADYSKFSDIYLYHIMKHLNLDQEILEYIQNNIKDFSVKDEKVKSYNTDNKYLLFLVKYLEQMGLEATTVYTISGIPLRGVYIESKNIFINILDKLNIYLNNNLPTGPEILKQKLYSSLSKDLKIINLNKFEFSKIEENIKKIEYLNNLGIPNQNVSGEYNFNEIESFFDHSNTSDIEVEEEADDLDLVEIDDDFEKEDEKGSSSDYDIENEDEDYNETQNN